MVASTLTASRVVADDARHVPMRIESFGSPSGGMASATEMVSVRARAIQHGATTEIPAEVGAELLAVASAWPASRFWSKIRRRTITRWSKRASQVDSWASDHEGSGKGANGGTGWYAWSSGGEVR